jgi:hypothetical protein
MLLWKMQSVEMHLINHHHWKIVVVRLWLVVIIGHVSLPTARRPGIVHIPTMAVN